MLSPTGIGFISQEKKKKKKKSKEKGGIDIVDSQSSPV